MDAGQSDEVGRIHQTYVTPEQSRKEIEKRGNSTEIKSKTCVSSDKNPKNSAMWSGNKAIVPLSKTGNENKTSESDRFFDFDAVDLDHARIGVRLNVVCPL